MNPLYSQTFLSIDTFNGLDDDIKGLLREHLSSEILNSIKRTKIPDYTITLKIKDICTSKAISKK